MGLSSAHCCPSQCLSTQFPRHLTSPCVSFVTEDDVRTDMGKHVTKYDKLLKKYAGDVFADTQLDEEFHSIVDRDVTAEERIELFSRVSSVSVKKPDILDQRFVNFICIID